jgi:hypothetical protein
MRKKHSFKLPNNLLANSNIEWVFTHYGIKGIGLAVLLMAFVSRNSDCVINPDYMVDYGKRMCPEIDVSDIISIVYESDLFIIWEQNNTKRAILNPLESAK